FVAVQFFDRDTMAGYAGQPFFETMVFGANPGGDAVQTWIDSIWHRTPVLSPWVRDVGYGDTGRDCATMDFGAGERAANNIVATWPVDGQTGVPTQFDGSREGPPPPRPETGWPSGYPITIYLKGTLTAHSLTIDGSSEEIPHFFFGPGDSLSMGLL